LISAEVIWDLRQCSVLADDWAALDEIGLCEPSTSLEWTRALLATHVAASDVTFAVLLRSRARAVAIIPAIIRHERVAGRLHVSTLYLLSEVSGTHSDILRSDDQQEIAAAFFEALAALPCRWDMLRVSRLLESSPVAAQLCGYLARSGLAHRVRREQPSFYLELGQSYEQFLAARSAKFRNHLRRKTRQLEAAGQVKFLRAGLDLGAEDAFGHLLAIEERSWKHAHGTAISAVPHQRKFYRLLCEGAAGRGRLHLMLMYLDDMPVAFNLGITAGDRYSYLKTSFDEKLRRFSPATILRARLVETLIAEGVRTLDFPAEPYQWEEQWTDTLRWHLSVLVFNRTPRAVIYRFLVGLRDLSRRSRDDKRVRYVDPRRLEGGVDGGA
jgi:CelD/BcsL family acetyltransferase involved in cellulose biosynthesis